MKNGTTVAHETEPFLMIPRVLKFISCKRLDRKRKIVVKLSTLIIVMDDTLISSYGYEYLHRFAAIAQRWRIIAAVMVMENEREPNDTKMKSSRKDWLKNVCLRVPNKFRIVYRMDVGSFNHFLGMI